MNWRTVFYGRTIRNLSKTNGELQLSNLYAFRNMPTVVAPLSILYFNPTDRSIIAKIFRFPTPISSFHRYIHSTQETKLCNSVQTFKSGSEEDDETMNEFLSRLVWIMRGKLVEAYPNCDKKTIDGMLLLIADKVISKLEKSGIEHMLESGGGSTSKDFSEDLWKTIWEVSQMVLDDMNKEKKKKKMRGFLQSEEVKEMCRFAGEVGIRGDMLRELRFKWARDKMEECEFYESLECLRREAQAQEKEVSEGEEVEVSREEKKVVTLPKRKGKIRYRIYGLDLSDSKWSEVADKVYEREEVTWPQEPKPISGKCKLVTEKILSMNEEDDPSSLLAEWVELLQPTRIDWIALLDRLKESNPSLYFKVAELALNEASFQANVHDYSKLIDLHSKEERLDEAERVIKKMRENDIPPDILTVIVLFHMYSKAGNHERAREAFETLSSQGFQPDYTVYKMMIMGYINAGEPKMGETLMRNMEARDIKPTEEMYLAFLRSFAQCGDAVGAGRILTSMQFAGFQPGLEACTLLVEACGKAGELDQARSNFDNIINIGLKPDDRCTASMIAAYEKYNLLDKALELLFQLEKDGFEPGVATYTVLLDWFAKLQLLDEAEQVLGKISCLNETPPFKVHVSLCDMYARARIEKKALQHLGVLEAKKEELGQDEMERIAQSLFDGGFVQDARRIHGLMESRGFSANDSLKMLLLTSQTLGTMRSRFR